MMYSDQLPTGLVEQVTEIADSAFLAIEKAHHLWRVINVSLVVAVV